ncbi:unnamed protein product [Angiostrongylus costaricensis]|uniref:Glyco_transf_7N domain-containing protein n=1 Tax=Angiostrongylus costaricensis TaxID=334426 RepID=A0A0R3PYR3_ANGCS|nr:unnamed protein product [Angiostrongylus costaricensis]
MWHLAIMTVILFVALVLNIYVLVDMHRKECNIIETQNYEAVKEGSFEIWTGVINFFPELHDVAPKALQPLHLSPTKSVHKKLVIGIPLAAERTRYISGTLSSLFDKLDEDYRNDVMVLLMIASNETDAENFSEKTAWIQGNFSKEIESGLMKVIAVPKAWYRIAVRSVPPTFGDPLERMYWRTKQNIDYIYIMTYASQMCDYYLQLEDDVEAANGYMRVIFNYLIFKSNSPWFLISFTTIGFIGKLFRCPEHVRNRFCGIGFLFSLLPVGSLITLMSPLSRS